MENKAQKYIIDAISQADSNISTDVGSVVRSLLVNPSSHIYAALFKDIEILRGLHLGNYSRLSESQMDELASNLLVERPEGTRSVTNLRLYTKNIESSFSLSSVPYFHNGQGIFFKPPFDITFTVEDYVEDEFGKNYVNVPVICTQFGIIGRLAENTITKHSGLPVSILRVTNPSPTEGGDDQMANPEFFEFIKTAINDGTLSQISGLESFILRNFSEVADINVVDSSDDLMVRDELWTEDSVIPNLERKGRPFAAHTDYEDIVFYAGRGKGIEGLVVGDRLEIEGDEEKFRNVIHVDGDEFIVSGSNLTVETADVKKWGNGIRVGNMTDVYVYVPTLQINSVIIDKSIPFTVVESGASTLKVISTKELVGNVVVFNIGTTDELVLEVDELVTETLEDNTFSTTFTFVSGWPTTIPSSGLIVDTSGLIEISENGDITALPLIHILRVETLNPLSYVTDRKISATEPGMNASPGWYIKNTDPAQVFSSRENKTLVIDTKESFSNFSAFQNSFCSITRVSSFHETDRVELGGQDFSGFEGREVTIVVPEFILTNPEVGTMGDDTTPEVVNYVGVEGSTDTLSCAALSGEWIVGTEGRTGVSVECYNGVGPNYDLMFTIDNCTVKGTHIINTSGNWTAGIDRVCLIGEGDVTISEVTYNTLILRGEDGFIDVLVEDGFKIKHDGEDEDGAVLTQVEISLEDSFENYNLYPIRVIYATHSVFNVIQGAVDDEEVRNTCTDTLVRSFFPSLLDMSIRYKGTSTPTEVQTKILDLVQTSLREQGELLLDISDVINALNEEGLADYVDPNFEVRIRNFLQDGEYETRYLNPSGGTKLQMALYEARSSGDSIFTLKRLEPLTHSLPSRGKLFLGGNNPSTKEIAYYEAIVDNGDGTYIFVLRDPVEFEHVQWETVIVSNRDYDPLLEQRGNISVPISNRPYFSQLVVTKI